MAGSGQVIQIAPHYTRKSTSIRKAYIQNLVDLLHVCLLRRDTVRARRAWGILIRCREIDWRSRWYWGLECLNASNPATESQPAQSQPEYEGREVERWLKGTRVSAKEVDKPSLLHALVLHLIKHERFRHALDELETYLTSYPYLLSGHLHTYAGLLSFYLAQPQSALASLVPATKSTSRPQVDDDAENLPLDTASTSSRPSQHSEATTRQATRVQATRVTEPPNPGLIRQARAYFVKAVNLDGSDQVAADFIELIDHPDQARERSQSTVNRSRGESVGGSDGKSDEESVEGGKEEKHENIGSFSEDSETDLEDLMGLVDDSEGSEDDI